MKKYSYILFNQPGGEFYFCVIPAKDLLQNYTIDQRSYTGSKSSGTQRKLRDDRVERIADFCNTADASFPTAMILTVQKGGYNIDNNVIEFMSELEVIDGQHRIEGLSRALEKYGESCIEQFDLPCVIILEATEEQKAFLFATVNGEQVKVPKSFVYDLFGVSKEDDVYKILHLTARKLNYNNSSPFFRKLKMLGSKTVGIESESLTQGTFIDELVPKMSKDPLSDRNIIKTKGYEKLPEYSDLVLRPYLFEGGADYLYDLFSNIFDAVKHVFPVEWDDHKNYILSKTTGYIGIMKAIDPILKYGLENEDVTQDFFLKLFLKLKLKLEKEGLILNNKDFQAGSTGQSRLRDYLLKCWEDYQTELNSKEIK